MRVTDKELWHNGCLTRFQLETWTDADLAKHPVGIRKTIQFLLEIIDNAPEDIAQEVEADRGR